MYNVFVLHRLVQWTVGLGYHGTPIPGFFLKKKHTQDSAFFILLFQVLVDLVFVEQDRIVRARPLIVLWKTSSGTLHAGITDLTGVSLALFLPR